jgi:hypothetical protein
MTVIRSLTREDVLKAVETYPGLTNTELGILLSAPSAKVQQHLWRLSKAGEVTNCNPSESRQPGQPARWVAGGVEEVTSLGEEVMQRIVPASTARPLPIIGPRCVWDLAA